MITELYEYTMKRGMIAVGTVACGLLPARCAPTWASVYRMSQDGTWRTFAFDYSKAAALIIGQAPPTHTAEMAAADVTFAERFIAASGAPRSCVVLSAAPSPLVNSDAYVEEMGRLLGARAALPKMGGLTTFDGNHLSPDSAERWSSALLEEIGGTLEDCAKQ